MDIIHDFYFSKSPKAANTIINGILDAGNDLNKIALHQQEAHLPEGFRRFIYKYFKIIYRIDENQVIRILRIFDSRQNPEILIVMSNLNIHKVINAAPSIPV